MTDKNGVAVYCASSDRVDRVFLDSARRMGQLLAANGLDLVCGGGRMGLMGAAIEGATEAGGRAVGVLPQFMIDRGWAHPALTETISTPSMHVRKYTMADRACGAVALAGGIGTLDELAEIMTWHQLGLFKGPVVIVNTDGFYDSLIEMFETMRRRGFMRGDVIPARVATTPDEALAMILESR